MLAHRQLQEGKYASAHVNFLLCRDVEYAAKTLLELMKIGYDSEKDLFIARGMLEFISRTDKFELSKKFRAYFPEVSSPLITFAELLPELIAIKDFEMYKEVLGKYDPHIQRDPALMNVRYISFT